MKLQINRSFEGKFTSIDNILEGYPEIYANKMATELVVNSPVDTGAYMENFYAGSGYSGVGSSSTGKTRNQNWQDYADDAISRMSSQIEGLLDSTSITFGNSAPHAFEVEYEHGYAPFGKASREHGRIAQEAEVEAKEKYG